MTRRLTMAVGALLGALLVLAIPLVLAADGDTNWTNGVFSGDVTVGDDLAVADDAAITGDLAVSGSTSLAAVAATGRVTAGTLLGGGGCPDLASAATIAPVEYCHYITGTTSITNITTGSFVDGDMLVMIFDGSVTVTEGNDIVSAGNFAAGAKDAITFMFVNTEFVEMNRSNN